MLPVRETDVLVIGSGIAGLFCTLQLCKHARILLVSKGKLHLSNSQQAQGGVAVALDRDDSPAQHMLDTLRCGIGLNDAKATRLLTEKSREVLEDLLHYGVPFDRDGRQRLSLTKEGFHSHPRIVHAGGDATGKAIVHTLMAKVRSETNIDVLEEAFVEQLCCPDGVCQGAVLYHRGVHMLVNSKVTVLAAGGAGQLYVETTNIALSTGDGYALAARAGSVLKDMEFVQFHPTALDCSAQPKPLISEAVRGEGARLINDEGRPFMSAYHPWGDLAPRDVVSRAIIEEMQKGRKVFLDTSPIGERFVSRFPHIYRQCRDNGFDPIHNLIPVTPAAHFMMGGVRTDLNGRTDISQLYACGENACTGVHGANRLASNSLLEGLIFGKQIAADVVRRAGTGPVPLSKRQLSIEYRPRYAPRTYRISNIELWSDGRMKELRRLMWRHAGIVRHEQGLKKVLSKLIAWQEDKPWHPVWENLCIGALAVVQSALERKESRGAHFRSDYPQQTEEGLRQRSQWRYTYEHHFCP